MGKSAQALLAVLDTACANVDELGLASAELFQQAHRLYIPTRAQTRGR
jgi:hypothetical protein